MLSLLCVLVLFISSAQLDKRSVENIKMSLIESSSSSLLESSSSSSLEAAHHGHDEGAHHHQLHHHHHHAPRVPRASRSKPRERHPDPFFTTPRTFNGSLRVHNPLFPVTEESYSAYAVMLLALIVFSVGIVGNLALMCIVWHSYHLKSTWHCALASLALWDFTVLFFCLPVVIFNELTKRRLMGDLSCRIVPYVEVCVLIINQSINQSNVHVTGPTRPAPRGVRTRLSL